MEWIRKVEERKKVQIYTKVDGMKTVVMDMSPKDKIQKILETASGGHWNVYADLRGKDPEERRRNGELRGSRREHSADHEQDERRRKAQGQEEQSGEEAR